MPGNVRVANPVGVLPFSLAKSYQRQKKYECNVNFYPDGRHERGALVGSQRSTWVLGKRLSAVEWNALFTFYLQKQGPVQPFWTYDCYEANFHYDVTGVSALGRYAVRFQGSLEMTLDLARVETNLSLIEVA